jgi:hypothetical protein
MAPPESSTVVRKTFQPVLSAPRDCTQRTLRLSRGASAEALCESQQEDRRNDGHDEAQDVELEDVAGPEEACDHSTDHGTNDAYDERHHDAEVLVSRLDEPRRRTDY